MTRRLLSIDLKFPVLMCGIVLVTSAVLMGAAYRRFAETLLATDGERLRSAARLVASQISSAVPVMEAQLTEIAQSDAVRALLARPDDVRARARVADTFTATTDSSVVQLRVLATDGRELVATTATEARVATSWMDLQIQAGALDTTGLVVGPIIAVDSMGQFEIAAPVRQRGDAQVAGWLVQTRALRGRGVETFQRLAGTSTILVGHPSAGAWSDLRVIVPPPPRVVATDSVVRFDSSSRGAGIGVAEAVAGTPWVVWMQLPRAQVLAPVTGLARQMAGAALLVALIASVVTWMASRRVTRRIARLTSLVGSTDTVRSSARAFPLLGDGRDEIDRLEGSFSQMLARAAQQQRLEAQLHQSQKLEAIGRLAGGIAHDFNNVLTVVTNYSELIAHELPPESPAARDMREILQASERAARLTRQLLAFSGRQTLQPVRLDLNEAVDIAVRMLQRVLPSHVEIQCEVDPAIPAVMADPGQVEQVLLNLALNASDAMPDGGRLTFRTTFVSASQLPGPDSALDGAQGDHVGLLVSDTGTGMSTETAQHIFEPFFTTKPAGKGTGLGLASVHGIITQLGGRILVQSELGRGTTFSLFFPAVEGMPESLSRTGSHRLTPRGSGTILLVEDDPATRAVTRRILAADGFAVIEAIDGNDALTALRTTAIPIRLVISDVMMPGMSGVALAQHIAREWPALPVLLMSGYSHEEVQEHATATSEWMFLHKPFTSQSMRDAVRAVLDDATPEDPSTAPPPR